MLLFFNHIISKLLYIHFLLTAVKAKLVLKLSLKRKKLKKIEVGITIVPISSVSKAAFVALRGNLSVLLLGYVELVDCRIELLLMSYFYH